MFGGPPQPYGGQQPYGPQYRAPGPQGAPGYPPQQSFPPQQSLAPQQGFPPPGFPSPGFPQRKRSDVGLVVGICAVLVLAVAIGVGYIFVMKSDSGSNEAGSSSTASPSSHSDGSGSDNPGSSQSDPDTSPGGAPEVPADKLARAVKGLVDSKLGETSLSVTCAGTLVPQIGRTQHCTMIRADGSPLALIATVTAVNVSTQEVKFDVSDDPGGLGQ